MKNFIQFKTVNDKRKKGKLTSTINIIIAVHLNSALAKSTSLKKHSIKSKNIKFYFWNTMPSCMVLTSFSPTWTTRKPCSSIFCFRRS